MPTPSSRELQESGSARADPECPAQDVLSTEQAPGPLHWRPRSGERAADRAVVGAGKVVCALSPPKLVLDREAGRARFTWGDICGQQVWEVEPAPRASPTPPARQEPHRRTLLQEC